MLDVNCGPLSDMTWILGMMTRTTHNRQSLSTVNSVHLVSKGFQVGLSGLLDLRPLTMEVDTGAAVSLVFEEMKMAMLLRAKLRPTRLC